MPTRRSSCPKTPTFLPQLFKPVLSGSRLWEPDDNGGLAMYLTIGRLVPDPRSSGTLQFHHFHLAPTSGSQTKWAQNVEAKTSGSLGMLTAYGHFIIICVLSWIWSWMYEFYPMFIIAFITHWSWFLSILVIYHSLCVISYVYHCVIITLSYI